jgi:hypothetical protein
MLLGAVVVLGVGLAADRFDWMTRDSRTTATAPSGPPEGESFDGFEIAADDPRRAAESGPLALRRTCAWGVPGRNRYEGTVGQVLAGAKLPTAVVHRIEGMVERGQVSDVVEISTDGITSVRGRRQYDTTIKAMGFGRTLCFNTKVNFRRGHVERADLYEVADADGTNYAVMVPYVCGNVSVLAARAERPDAVAGGSIPGAGRAGRQGTQSTQGGGSESQSGEGGGGTQSVPEPSTLVILLAGLVAMALALRRPRAGRTPEARADRPDDTN